MSNDTSSRRGFIRKALGAAAVAVVAPYAAFGTINVGDPPTNSAGTESEIPAKLFMGQNYPNPFNSTTSIRYGLPSAASARLSLHTLLGAEMQMVFERDQEAGLYVIEISGSSLPSGVYFYRLQTSLGTLTRRMTVAR